MVAVVEKSALVRIVRLTHSRRNGPNRIMTKALWLKKGDWQERGPVADQCHDRSGKSDKRSDKKLGHKSSKRQSSDARQEECVFQDMDAEVDLNLTEELKHGENDPACKVQEGYCASY